MGLSRNKVAVPEGAAGTPPFWRVSTQVNTLKSNPKGVPDAARRKPSESGNTSFLERTLLVRYVMKSSPVLVDWMVCGLPLLLSASCFYVSIEDEGSWVIP